MWQDRWAPWEFLFNTVIRKLGRVYHKLFYGNHLPSMTPDGSEYIPQWNQEELDLLRAVLNEGLTLFRPVPGLGTRPMTCELE